MKKKNVITGSSDGFEKGYGRDSFTKKVMGYHQYNRKQADTILVLMFLVAIFVVAGCLIVYATS
jgi:hypothetical protein